MARMIQCIKLGREAEGLDFPPYPGELGKRIYEQTCQACWKAWLATQNQLINHYGLSTINPEHQQFLIENMQAFLFGTGKQAEIDTSLQGKVSH